MAEYRSCAFFKNNIALGAVFRGELGPRNHRKEDDGLQSKALEEPACRSQRGMYF